MTEKWLREILSYYKFSMRCGIYAYFSGVYRLHSSAKYFLCCSGGFLVGNIADRLQVGIEFGWFKKSMTQVIQQFVPLPVHIVW